MTLAANTELDFDFDTPIDRRGSGAKKWDGTLDGFGIEGDDVLPLWVADMDFRSPSAVAEAVHAAAEHGIFGYHKAGGRHHEAVANWMQRRHGWRIEQDWIVDTPGVVAAMHVVVRAFCKPGDRVLLQPPLYHPFAWSIRNSGCEVANAPMTNASGRYEMDLDRLVSLVDDRTRMLMLCSPHNPTGQVWTRSELEALVTVCAENGVLIVSDEIHHDLVFSPYEHLVTATIDGLDPSLLITMTAASKTFNLAGAKAGNVIIADDDLRAAYVTAQENGGTFSTNMFGPITSTAAYDHGEAWLDALLVYLKANRDRLSQVIDEQLPGVSCRPAEGTYLAWLNFAETGLSQAELNDRTRNAARLAVTDGSIFGPGGDRHLRINFACPRSTLDTALERLVDAFNQPE